MSTSESTTTERSVKQPTAADENRFHSYVGSRIPWYVRLIWIGFWVFAIYYVITFLFPDLQTEIVNPP